MSSRSFRTIPESALRTWSLNTMNLTATPTTNAALDTTYESPLREITLGVEFLNQTAIENLKYVVDEESFIPEWEFAQESWEQLIEGITGLITEYNKTIIRRARDLHLNTVSVVGRAKTVYNLNTPSSVPMASERNPIDNMYGSSNRVETTYEPSIRSATTRQSARVKVHPLADWIVGTHPRRR